MSGTSLVLLAMYSTVNVVSPNGAIAAETIPYLTALLMLAAACCCVASLSLYNPPSRRVPRGPVLHKARRFSGPRHRRV